MAQVCREYSTLQCVICSGDRQFRGLANTISDDEATVWDIIDSMDVIYVVQSQVVVGFTGMVDIYLPASMLIVQLDGVGHYKKGFSTRSVNAQQATDAKLTQLAAAQGYNVLRILDADLGTAQQLISQAVQQCAATAAGTVHMWSPSYNRPTVIL